MSLPQKAGFCHRFPKWSGDEEWHGWPVTDYHDWCGEWQGKGAEIKSEAKPAAVDESKWLEFYSSLSNRVQNMIYKEGVDSFETFLKISSPFQMRSFGNKSYEELIGKMNEFGVPIPTRWSM